MCSKQKNVSYQSKVNVHKKKAYVSKCKQKNEEDRNTTPSLPVKTPTSQGTSRKVSIVGGATPSARIKVGEEWGDVAGGSNQGGRNGSWSAYNGGGCAWSGDDNRNIVMGCMRKTNHGNRSSGFGSGSSRGRGSWSRCRDLLLSNVVNDSSGGRDLGLSTCLN